MLVQNMLIATSNTLNSHQRDCSSMNYKMHKVLGDELYIVEHE